MNLNSWDERCDVQDSFNGVPLLSDVPLNPESSSYALIYFSRRIFRRRILGKYCWNCRIFLFTISDVNTTISNIFYYRRYWMKKIIIPYWRIKNEVSENIEILLYTRWNITDKVPILHSFDFLHFIILKNSHCIDNSKFTCSLCFTTFWLPSGWIFSILTHVSTRFETI